MTSLGYALLGFGGLFVWSGIANPPGGLWAEFGRVIRGQQPAGKIGSGGGVASWFAGITDAQQAASSDLIAAAGKAGEMYSKAIAFAKSQLGKPYVWGGTGPNGWDCSGLTQAAYAAGGIVVPRTSEAQSVFGTPIGEAEALPGDAVCFGVIAGAAHHIGIYLGNGQMIHAPKTGGVVEIIAVWHTEPMFYRRMLPVAAGSVIVNQSAPHPNGSTT